MSLIRKIFALVALSTFSLGGAISAQAELVDATLAVVNDDVILLSQFDEELVIRVQEMGKSQLSTLDMNIFGNQVLQDLIDNSLLIQAADDVGIYISDSEVEPYVNDHVDFFKSNFESISDYQIFLEEQGINERELRKRYFERIHDDMMISRYLMQEVSPKIRISEDEIADYFKTHEDELLLPTYVDFELLEVPKVPGEAEMEAVRQKLLELKTRAEAGEDFGELAKQYSEFSFDAPKGGYLDFFERGKYYPEFENVAFSLEVGEISEPVLTKDGMQIIKLEAKKNEAIAVRHIVMSVDLAPQQLVRLRLLAEELIPLLSESDTANEALEKADIPSGVEVNAYSVPQSELDLMTQDYPKLALQLENAEPGEVSDLIEDQFAIFISKLNSINPGGKPSQEEARNMIKDILWAEKMGQEKDKLVQKLRARAYIMIHGD